LDPSVFVGKVVKAKKTFLDFYNFYICNWTHWSTKWKGRLSILANIWRIMHYC